MNAFTNLVNEFIAISHNNFTLIQFSELVNKDNKINIKRRFRYIVQVKISISKSKSGELL